MSPVRPLHKPLLGHAPRVAAWFAICLSIGPVVALAIDPVQSGKKIYMAQCATCHGKAGEGVADKYDEPLYGELPLAELTEVITKTMPDEQPERCVGDDAKNVAQYLYDSFYTAASRAKLEAPRVALSHLTTHQYENSVADILAEFLGRGRWDDQRGLSATYYNDRRYNSKKLAFKRVDPHVDFQYGEGSPGEKLDKSTFAILWTGSILIEETGTYEFCLRTENGARLWINDTTNRLVDAWVTNGEMQDERNRVKLLGGRSYPLKLEYFKYKGKSASIQLCWRPPGKSLEVIPTRNLIPQSAPSTMVVTTPFPPDDGSYGYERGIGVSKAWDEATTYAAVEVAKFVGQQIERLARTKRDAKDYRDKLHDFCGRFAETAFRRPLSDLQKSVYVDQHFQSDVATELALKRSVLLILKSPRFLYPLLTEQDDDFQIASRLSYALWDSIPDRPLIEQARRGGLKNEQVVRGQAKRMLADPRARAKIHAFFHEWLPFEEGDDLSKSEEAYPEFDDRIISDLRTSLELFLEHVVWDEKSDFRKLLTSESLFLNQRLADFYGLEELEGSGFQEVQLEAGKRAGVITHPFLLSALSYRAATSPIHRGVFATRRILGRTLRPPPMAIEFVDAKFDPSLTMREKVTELTKSDSCQTCHHIINPLGFSLENFDAVGRFREKDGEQPVDASGVYKTLDGKSLQLGGARDLAEYAAHSTDAQKSFVTQLFQYTVKQPPPAYGADSIDQLHARFAKNEFNIQKLFVDIGVMATGQGVLRQEKPDEN